MLNSLAMFGGQDMIIVLVVVLVLFGGSKIPQLMRGIGQGVGELKKGLDDVNK
jgi:sec-independent protein translocase protein TatA